MRVAKVALEIEARVKESGARDRGGDTERRWMVKRRWNQPAPLKLLSCGCKAFLSRLCAERGPGSDDQIVKLSVAVITAVITGRNNT